MKVIFLHGAPATGKLTIARALLRQVPGRLLDNHAAIDVARPLFDFGAPGFWELVHDVRVAALNAAGRHNVPLVVMTFCYSAPGDLPQLEAFETIVQRHCGQMLPVFLHCPEDEIIRRIGNADRVARRKIASMEGLARFRIDYNDAPVPRADCLKLDTATRPAEASAREIIEYFRLDVSRIS
jgi:hypothetical protein